MKLPLKSDSSLLWLSALDGRAEILVLQEQGGVVGAQMSPFEVEAAVDENGLAGDVARQIRQEEKDGAGLLIGPRAPPHRNGAAVALRILVDVGAGSRGDGGPGRDRVHADVVERELDRQGAGHLYDRRLRRTVRQVERRRVHTADR